MAITKKLDPLAEALERLEQQLELPHVSGELHTWADGVLNLMQESAALVRKAIENEHPRAFETITKNHSNLRTQVDKLQEDDAQILTVLPAVLQQAQQFADGIDETVLAEQQFHPKRERLINDGLSLILRVRRQQAAVSTWMGEALQRDNGVGD